MNKKFIVIVCIVLVVIASIDTAETEAKKKKKKSKKVKNVQSDAANEPQAQQANYDYTENYDDENYHEYDESESGNGVTGECNIDIFITHKLNCAIVIHFFMTNAMQSKII